LELRIFCFVVSGVLFVDSRSCCLPSVCFFTKFRSRSYTLYEPVSFMAHNVFAYAG
jgi:hypothetical protein